MNKETTKLFFLPDNAKDFAQTYNKARQANQETFMWQEKEFVLEHAFYLIQHLVNEKLLEGNFYGNKIFNIKKDTK